MNRHLPVRLVLAGIPLFALSLFVACGDDIENTTINQTGVELFDSSEDLPECTDKNESDLVFVRGETSARICVDGEWIALSSDGSDVDFSCKTVELKDKSGLKIVCNGDSIGVVLNGSDGKAGEDGNDGVSGTGCSITDRNDTAVVVTCGDSTMTIDLGYRLPTDTAEADSERTPISLDSIVGLTQKGPFLKGSTVYLYELSDGRTLKQTNGNFTSNITSDNGRYRFSARDLVSQYAMIVVDGYYRNEVTGGSSDAPIRLKAITDMRKRSSVNVNILTQMEFDRVYQLVTRGDSTGKKLTVKHAKRQAQKEILKQFYIELDDNTDAEDMDVFGKTEADAALLAVSVLLQGDSNETALTVLLSEISRAIEQNGEWSDSSTKMRLADWALKAESNDRLSQFRKNVADWHLSDTVPEFEKIVRRYVGIESGLGVCGSDSVSVNTAVNISKPASSYYSKAYAGTSSKYSKVRFICKTDGGARWRFATDLEKDSLGWGHDFAEGSVQKGIVNTSLPYVYENGNWRHGSVLDGVVNLGCINARKDTVAKGSDNVWYKCIGDTTMRYFTMNLNESEWGSAWRKASNLEMDTATWGHKNYIEGQVRNGKVNGGLTYVYENGNWRPGTSLDSIVGFGCTQAMVQKDTIHKASKNVWYKCDVSSNGGSAWRLMDKLEKDMVYWESMKQFATVDSAGFLLEGPFTGETKVWDADTLRNASDYEVLLKRGCVTSMFGASTRLSNTLTYTCSNTGWSKIGTFYDGRGKTYKAVQIGTQVWMAENLNYEYKSTIGYREDIIFGTLKVDSAYGSYCYKDDPDNCAKYGRLYTWAAAIDSAGLERDNGIVCGYKKTCTLPARVQGSCPSGWHLPDTTEWNKLFEAIGAKLVPQLSILDTIYVRGNAGTLLKSQSDWFNNQNGIDAYSFTALPEYKDGSATSFWSTTQKQSYYAHTMTLTSFYDYAIFNYSSKDDKNPIRCVKD